MRVEVPPQGSAGGSHEPGRSARAAEKRAVSPTRARAGLFSAPRLAIMRLARGWHLLLAATVGILVAVVLICTVPIYNTLVADLQLQREIGGNSPIARNIEVQAQSNQVADAIRKAANPQVIDQANRYLSGFTARQSTYYVVSDQVMLTQVGATSYDPVHAQPPVAILQAFDYSTTAAHMRFVEGGPPQATAAGQAPQVIITKELADDQHLKVGDQLVITQFGHHEDHFAAKIAGIWEPRDANDPYWNGLEFQARGSVDAPAIYPVQMTLDGFYNALKPFAGLGMTQHWVFYVEPARISTTNMAQMSDAIGRFRAQMNGDLLSTPGVTQISILGNLDHMIQDIEQQQALLALPLYVIVAQIVGLALLFVAAMASLLIEGQSQEIATLKSRGISLTQVLGIFTTQGLLVSALAAVVGPFLASFLALTLAHQFLASANLQTPAVSQEYLAKAAAPGSVALPAAAGALLGVGALAFSVWQAARLDVLAFRREQARASRVPFWRRYYLDIGLVILCLVGYLELGQFGSTTTRLQLNGDGTSPLLLVTPALLLLAGGLLVLRVVPLAATAGERLAARGRGITSLLAFAQVERNPARYARTTLLLVLAVGVGLFALSFDASLTQNVHDQVAYQVGADVRLVQRGQEGEPIGSRLLTQLQHLPGVTDVTPVLRNQGNTTPDEGNLNTDVLAIDPATFGQVTGSTSWRADYADQPLTTLLAQMRAHQQSTDSGPTEPIWALVSQTFADQLHLKVGDRFTLQLGNAFAAGTSLVVGAIVHEFPTVYPEQSLTGFVVFDLSDYSNTILSLAPGDAGIVGPNEYWLRTTSDAAQHKALLTALAQGQYDVQDVVSLREQLATAQANPISAGMRGLLLVGALTAALLAVLGVIVQSLLAARQRTTQFAIMRTIGMAGGQLTGLLLSEQAVVYLFGLLGGTLLGLLLTTATLPFLQFSSATINPNTLGVPPYVLRFNPTGIAAFYGVLLIAFVIALLIAARYAARVGLGKALRLGED